VDAGLAKVKHYSRMKSKDAPLRREGSEISFHSLRHSAVTMLKAADVSDFIAREVIGHESEAISRQYSHLTTDHKRAAMRNLPDVTQS
jgi:integrase